MSMTDALLDWKDCMELWHRESPYDPHLHLETWKQRRQFGKMLRAKMPRKTHGNWWPSECRPDPIAMLIETGRTRQTHLLPIRIGRMASSPYAFFRGSAAIMAWDLAQTPISGAYVIANGDVHLNNFGLYGTPQRTLVFDLDDFDEIAYGPWEWDLKRLAASVNVAGRDHNLDRGDRREAVMACVSGYQKHAEHLQSLRILEVWYLHHYPGKQHPIFKLDRKTRKVFKKAVDKAKTRTNVTLLQKVAQRSKQGNWRFDNDPPILERVDVATAEKVVQSLVLYAKTLTRERGLMFQRYRVADVAHRVVGVGSVGLRAYLVMLFGNDDDDPLFLQVKEAAPSVLAPYTPPLPASIDHEGERVVRGQRILQAATDVLLGWTTIDGRPFHVRQMKNMKGSIPLEWLEGSAFLMYAQACGTLLARAHARSGDIAKIAGYCGKSEALADAIAGFAEAYGDQTERDFDALLKAIASGQVVAKRGV